MHAHDRETSQNGDLCRHCPSQTVVIQLPIPMELPTSHHKRTGAQAQSITPSLWATSHSNRRLEDT
jgi:hypothetical protein